MVDRQFSEPHLAALYDPLCGREERADFRFYLPLVMAAEAVLDVRCGTGALLHWARECGHAGRLVGLDPAHGVLQVARTRSDIEWILGDLYAASWHREFDLAVMTGHAFQVLVSDHEIRTALATIYTASGPSLAAPHPVRGTQLPPGTLHMAAQRAVDVGLIATASTRASRTYNNVVTAGRVTHNRRYRTRVPGSPD